MAPKDPVSGRAARSHPDRAAPSVACLLATAALLLCPVRAVTGGGPARPVNVLLVIVDDLNTSLACYGNPVVKSPAIDRLAARGVRFANAHCQYPLCHPSRVSFLSGLRPETTGVYVLDTPVRAAIPQTVLLPEFFRRQGYFAGAAGKVFHSPATNDRSAWDFYDDGPGQDPQEQAAVAARRGGGDGKPVWLELDGDGSRTRDGLNTATIVRLLEEKFQAGTPFFLAAGLHKPHLPWTAPRRFFDLYPEGSVAEPAEPPMRGVPGVALQTELSGFDPPDSRAAAIRGYYACVSFSDHQVGRLLEALDRQDAWNHTVVVLLGDNGFHLGDHGGLWAKLSAFRQSTQVPLIIAGAGVPAGRVVPEPVELLDIYPTLAELARFPPPPGLEGRSLVALMHGCQEPGPDRPARTLVAHYEPMQRRDIVGRTLIGRNWRLTVWGDLEAAEFYRHESDPGECRNSVDDPAQLPTLRTAQTLLRQLPAPRPGPYNRPRALAR